MKYLTLIVFGAGIVAGSAFYVSRARPVKIAATQVSSEPGTAARANEPAPVARAKDQHSQAPTDTTSPEPKEQSSAMVPSSKLDVARLRQAVDSLTSPAVSFIQKQAIWKQLKDNGGLDGAIHELEQRVAGNGGSAENAAVLGNAYLQKCGTTSDVREQGILAMQADKLFDTALNLDPGNWEARFTKAVALSYWPASMGKSEEVLQHFTTLIQQQETQPPQPEFADSYLWLGEQYQKGGRNEDARSVWERGAHFFPDNDKLRGKLSALR